MKRVDPVSICEKFNTVRMKYLHNKKFSPEQLKKVLIEEVGMSNIYIVEAKRRNFFRSRKQGTSVEYCFTDNPINKGQFIKLYDDMRVVFNKQRSKKNVTKVSADDIQKAIDLLKAEGYIIYRDDGIDERKLQTELPEIYEKYKKVKML